MKVFKYEIRFMPNLVSIMITAIMLISNNHLFATLETYSKRYEASAFSPTTNPTGINFFIEDGRFAELTGTPAFSDDEVYLRVKFGVHERSTFGYVTPYASLSALVTIYPVQNNGTVLSPLAVQTLTISYDPTSASSSIKYTSIFKHSGYHKYKIHVDPISSAPANIYLEAELSVDRYYEIPQTTPTTVGANYVIYNPTTGAETQSPIGDQNADIPGVGELEVHWDYIQGAEEYELEWTWIDNYAENNYATYLTAASMQFDERDFELNNTRIITNKQFYRIPLIYARGYIIYRVRGVGRWIDNSFNDVHLKKFGPWSSGTISAGAHVSAWPHFVRINQEHELSKSWHYQAVYAEEGKKKEIVSYFDGSLRNRQTVTRINSDNNAIVGETVYDNQGRSAIQILPAPVANPALRYYQKLNLNLSNDPYSHLDFDWQLSQGTSCVASAGGMSVTNGASKYYSSNNTVKNNWQDYVPQAHNYPFVQVEYTPDNTGRVRKQSGVGPEYKIDGNHATQYFYLQPFQEELDRLFGYQVGYKTRYKKNLVVDANGQVSVSYIDPQGRVIATALAGVNTTGATTKTNLVSLDDETSGIHLTVSVDLLNKLGIDLPDSPADDNQLTVSGQNGSEADRLKFDQAHTPTDNDNPHNFTYRIRSSVFTECELSYPFAYDLFIDVRDECGFSAVDNVLLDDNTTTVGLPDGAINQTINTANSDYTITFNSLLDVQSYMIGKTLTVNEALLDQYALDFVANSTCLMPLDSFLFNNVDCDDEDPNAGEYEYAELNACNVALGMMLADVSPGGQYGETSGTDPLSVFSVTNALDEGAPTTTHHWQNPTTPYKDEFGNLAYIEVHETAPGIFEPAVVNPSLLTLSGSFFLSTPQNLLNVSDFVSNWDNNWAYSLVAHHPEYEYLTPFNQLCDSTGGPLSISAEQYDAALQSITTYAQATISTSNSLGINLLSSLNTIKTTDPYFNITYPYIDAVVSGGNTFKSSLMDEVMNNYKQDFPNNGQTMWVWACKAVLCGTDLGGTCTLSTAITNGNLTGLSTAQQDQIWQIYRGFYLAEKKKINQVFIDAYAIDLSFYNGYIGEDAPSNPTVTGFLYYMDYTLPTIGSALNLACTCTNYYASSPTLLDFYTTAISGGGMSWTNPLSVVFYQDKVRRFIPIDNLYDSSIPEDIMLVGTATEVDAEVYSQTGRCDLSFDVEIFLNGLAENNKIGQILSSSVSSNDAPYFTADLYQAMGGVLMAPGTGGVAVNITATTSGNDIIITANSADGLAPMATIELTKPSGSTWAWTDVVGFSTLWYDYGTSYNFEILATVMISGNPVEVVLTGTTDVQIGNCNYEVPCDREDNLGDEFYNIFNYMFSNSLLSTNSSANILTSDVTNGWYEGSEIQTQISDFASTATFANNSAGKFTITQGSKVIEVNFGSYPSNILYLSGAQFDASSTSGNLTIYYVTTAGVESTLSATVTYKISTVLTLFNVECPGCDPEEIIETAFEDLLNYLLAEQIDNNLGANGFSGFAQLNALEPYLTLSNPGIHYLAFANPPNYIYDATNFGFEFAKSTCPLTFQQIGTSYDLTQLVSVHNVQIIPNGVLYDISCKGVLDTGSGFIVVDLIALRFGCLNFEGCNSCTPDALRPLSCNEMWDDYNTTITSLNTTSTGLYDDFPTYTEEDFCAGNYAYVTTAYLQYISLLGITDNNHARYLSIAQFANTDIGYGYLNQSTGEDLVTLVTNFNLEHGQPTSTVTWHEYVTSQMDEITICPKQLPLPMDITIEFPCEQLTANIDTVNAQNQYDIYIANVIASFKERYIEEATSSVIENFDMTYSDREYHYTLYYYDQAGNLIQTVPPQGIDRIEQTEIDQPTIDNTRLSATMTTPTGTGTDILPVHTLKTNYHYNSLNQLTNQHTPDGGESNFAYDKLGRLVVSQNAKQQVHSGGEQFSYTRYDAIGRIVEVGEMTLSGNFSFNENGKLLNTSGALVDVDDANFPQNLGTALLGREEVTLTIYDEALSGAVELLFEDYADYNTRNRITGVLYFESMAGITDITTQYTNATFYDYDVHGNVKEVIQNNRDADLIALGQNIKKTKYEYDLVSGNVKEVDYQYTNKYTDIAQPDQFVHQYEYDGDNRITNVYTSKDRENWEQDAKYFYYEHGPLARVEIGQQKVQASDYAYTAQGWLKGVNSQDLSSNNDQGKDSKSGTINRMNGKDVYGFSLHYFDGATNAQDDYTARFGAADFLPHSNGTAAYNNPLNLYNGNIKEMYTANTNVTEQYVGNNHAWYSYDQLNRIKTMNSENINGSTITANPYNSSYSYDRNGNLKTLKRYATSKGTTNFDDFVYYYTTGKNQLTHVDDASSITATTDLADQNANNYKYDPIGQLDEDVSEDIDLINWKVTGKVKEIIYNDALNPNKSTSLNKIEFTYDAMGNRISKKVINLNGNYTTTYYVLDAQGNVMSIYTLDYVVSQPKNLYLSERYIYGSSRVGTENVNQIIASTVGGNVNINSENTANIIVQKVGDKSYELSNHLGNVLEVVTDRKLAFETSPGSGIVNYYSADVTSYSDYFPFGMTLPGRSGSAPDDYRYGFQNQEMDDELKGEGNSVNFKYRMYDPRIGRFFAVDPLSPKYPELTPYQFSHNNPIGMIEIEGLEGRPAHEVINRGSVFGKGSKAIDDKYILDRADEINGHTIRFVYPSPGTDINGNQVNGRVVTYVYNVDIQGWNIYTDFFADGFDDYKGYLPAPNTVERTNSGKYEGDGFFLYRDANGMPRAPDSRDDLAVSKEGITSVVNYATEEADIPFGATASVTVYFNIFAMDEEYIETAKQNATELYGENVSFVTTGSDSRGWTFEDSDAAYQVVVSYEGTGEKTTEAPPAIP